MIERDAAVRHPVIPYVDPRFTETRAAYRLFDHDAASEPGDAHRPPEARKGGGEGQDTETQGGGQGGPDQV